MYHPYYDLTEYRSDTTSPTSSISYTPIASSSRLLHKDDLWEIQFITTTYEVIRQTVQGHTSSISVEYIDKYQVIKYLNGKVYETIYLN